MRKVRRINPLRSPGSARWLEEESRADGELDMLRFYERSWQSTLQAGILGYARSMALYARKCAPEGYDSDCLRWLAEQEAAG